MAELQGGQKVRVLLAQALFGHPQALLLDEPTNHLDIEARDALVAALGAFEGAVILVSHDPRMVAATADRLWLVADGTCKPFDGDLDDYRRHLIDERRAAQRGGNGKKPPAGDKKAPVREQATVKREVSKADERRASAEARQKLKPLRQAVAHAEKQVDRLTKEKQGLEARLADPALYNGAPAEVTKIQRDLAHAIHELNAAEDAWLTAHEAYEDAAKTAG